MKNICIFAGLVLALNFVSCKKDNSNNSTNPDKATVQTGKWKITNFVDNSVDETSNFTSYEFTFNSNGTVSAVSSTTTVNGTWSLGTDDSKEKFILNFTNVQFEELGEDWLVVKIDDTVIQLSHTSGGNGGIETLSFGKK